MKRIGCAMLAVLTFGMSFAGCGSVDSETNMIFVEKKGQVQTVDVEEFDKSYYSEEDFKTFAQEAIDAYNKSHEVDAITLAEFTVEEDVAKLKMEYKSVKDFSNFNEITLYQGTVAAAVSDGYLFEVDFSKVEKGEVTGKATRADILAEEGLSVVIIKANTNVMVDGTICYVSTPNVTVTDKNTVSIYDEENTSLTTDVCTYIIYK
ncbi:MAG: hypothetical protein IKL06_08540 [Lachnospiraceae bacterium]|nr:hypothetical protein [Lachnospiraceae bacterium]